MRETDKLSKRQREETPLLFALWLVCRCREHGEPSVLWVRRRSVYEALGLDVWGKDRDARKYAARKYAGPGPVICHPPCGPWGKFWKNCHESQEHGRIAMELVHRWGGVVEQPVGSALFKVFGKGGTLTRVRQGDYGHLAPKPTLLYWYWP